jgi:hypothetical protein
MPPGLMPSPPGFLSPAAFPYQPPFPANDVPFPAGSPYLVARLTGAIAFGTTATIHVQNPTNPGDAICVMLGITGAAVTPVSVTDTQGNAYSLNVNYAGGNYGCNAIAVNANPLTAADTITITWSASAYQVGVVLGCPAASLGASSYLVPAVTNTNIALAAASFNSVSPAALSQPALLIIMLCIGGANSAANLLLQNSSGYGAWNITATSFNSAYPSGESMIAAWRIAPSIKVGQVIATALLGAATGDGAGMRFTAFIPETRFAPVGPHPNMPPGMMAPGAWQFTPLPRNGAVTGTQFLAGQTVTTASVADQVDRQLTGSASTTGTLGRQPGKSFAASATVTGTLARAAGKALTGAVAAAGNLTRQAARILTGSTAAAGSLTRQSGKGLATSASTAGSVTRQPGKTFTATAGAAGTITRQAGKALAGAVAASVNLIRQAVRTIAGSAAATGTLTRQAARQLDVTAEAAGSLVRTGPPITFTYDTPYFEWEYGTPYLS